MTAVSITVNGTAYPRELADAGLLLVDFLRGHLGLTGTHVGCNNGICGSCTILLDGEPVRACLLLAVQADGGQIVTIEGLRESAPRPAAPADDRGHQSRPGR